MRKGLLWAAGGLAAASAIGMTPVSAAPSGVDAGAVAAQVDQRREWQPAPAHDDVHIEVHQPQGAEDAANVRIDDIVFTGLADGVTEESLAPVVAPFLHQDQTAGGLWDIAAHVTEELHRRGYLAAIAVLPVQTVDAHRLTIEVVLGRYGRIGIENHSDLRTGRVVDFAHRLAPGDVIKERPLDRTLRLLNEMPGVVAHAYLSPGETAGTSDVLLKLDRTERQGGAVYVDDYGSRYTGRWRTGFSYHRDNLAHAGDVLFLTFLHGAGDGLDSYDARYEIPVGRDGVTAGVACYRTDYDLMRQYSKFDAYGMADGWRVFVRAPLVRSAARDVDVLAEFGTQRTADRVEVFAVDAEKHDETLRVGMDATWRTAQSAATLKLVHTFGHLRWDNAYARTGAEANGTAAHFQKTALKAYGITRLSPVWTLHATLSAQAAWDNLDSSERFYIGGYHAVRAFPQGEAGGDTGVLGSVELRAPIGRGLQAAVFYDAGWVRYARSPVTDGENARTLAGAGLGLIYRGMKNIYARLDYAAPLSDRWSESMGRQNHGMWWFQLVDRF